MVNAGALGGEDAITIIQTIHTKGTTTGKFAQPVALCMYASLRVQF
ncbi:hypothetical protein GCM10007086_24460 [Photobacterium aphoticum]|nr:hypothetical protein GCM10007086_24460 [Photobacterium aphoticum]